MKYFAYGSNMCLPRMRLRVPSATPHSVGRLNGYALRFHMKSRKDGSGKCNAYYTGSPRDAVWGVVYQIDPAQGKGLDLSEAAGICYGRKEVKILTADGYITAFTYVALSSSIDPGAVPFTWYKRFVLEGAIYHGLPREYIDFLRAITANDDPDRERDRIKRAIAKGVLDDALGAVNYSLR